ncbi:hypothetical protein BLX87_19505 [Bacillus sp. VT-16-64]|nr:hypothetical protein BLX87_19505 [Bacillus sp. VT-16-64]
MQESEIYKLEDFVTRKPPNLPPESRANTGASWRYQGKRSACGHSNNGGTAEEALSSLWKDGRAILFSIYLLKDHVRGEGS